MPLIPHPPLYLNEIRVLDIWLLLFVGAAYELTVRFCIFFNKRKPYSQKQKEAELALLEKETNRKRAMGPQAFVETSKLERQVLALTQELETAREERLAVIKRVESKYIKRSNMVLSLLVFILYYGVPIVTLTDYDPVVITNSNAIDGKMYLKSVLFPINSIGFGSRLARIGIPAEIAFNSVGALMVMWSSQVTVGKLMDAFDVYFLE